MSREGASETQGGGAGPGCGASRPEGLEGLLAAARERGRLARVTVEVAARLIQADQVALLLADGPDGELRRAAVTALKGEPDFPPRLAQGIGLVVAGAGQALLFDQGAADPRWDALGPLAEGRRSFSLVAVPVVGRQRLLGVLEALNGPDSAAFGPTHLGELNWLAAHLGCELEARGEAGGPASVLLEEQVRERTRQLRHAKQELERTFDAIDEPLFVLDGFTLRRVNLAVAEVAGRPVREVVGLRCHQALAGRDEPCPACPVVVGGTLGELAVRGRLVVVSTFETDGGGRVVHYRDVTRARELEARLRESQKMASVGQLAAGAAHEINNPLGFLISNLETLRRQLTALGPGLARLTRSQPLAAGGGPLEEAGLPDRTFFSPDDLEALAEGPHVLTESLEGAHRVHEIVRALGELARESKGGKAREDPFEILERAVKRAGLPRGRVVVVGRAVAEVEVEPVALEMALANVLRNAAQASPEAGSIRVRIERHGGRVVIAVADSGCGMSAEVRARAFEPFFSTRGVGRGLGLGLTAAWGVVSRLGGTLEIDSEPGRGTEVRIGLPCR